MISGMDWLLIPMDGCFVFNKKLKKAGVKEVILSKFYFSIRKKPLPLPSEN